MEEIFLTINKYMYIYSIILNVGFLMSSLTCFVLGLDHSWVEFFLVEFELCTLGKVKRREGTMISLSRNFELLKIKFYISSNTCIR